jgi:hypothetical protein
LQSFGTVIQNEKEAMYNVQYSKVTLATPNLKVHADTSLDMFKFSFQGTATSNL